MKNTLIKSVLIAVCVFEANLACTQVVYQFDTCGTALFAATSKGVYTTKNNGDDWVKCAGGLPAEAKFYRVAASASTIFAADYERDVYVSTDAGINWKPTNISSVLKGSASEIFIVGKRVFVANNGKGLFASDDNGNTWKEANTGLGNKKVFALAVKGNTLFAGTMKGVFKSADNGETWTPANEGLKKQVDFLAVKGSNLFAGIFAVNSKIYISKNDGVTWEQTGTGFLDNVSHFTGSGQNDNALFVAKSTPFKPDGGFSYTDDEGASWKYGGQETSLINTFFSKGTYLFAGTDNGFIRSADGGKMWEPVNNGFKKADYDHCIEKPYTEIGTQNGVTLAAKEFKDQVVLKITNSTAETANLSFKVTVSCADSNPAGGVSYTKNTATWRVSVPANSVKSFESNGAELKACSCSKKLENYVFDEWSAY